MESHLYYAVMFGCFETAKYLIEEEKHDPKQDGMYLLHVASKFGHLYLVQYLIEVQHLDPFEVDDQGMTPLAYAQMNHADDIIDYLVEHFYAKLQK